MELLFPTRCLFCKIDTVKAGQVICERCRDQLPYLNSPRCTCCGRELPDSGGEDHLCGDCLSHPPPYASARSVVRYEEPVSHLLRRLKFAADTSVLPALEQITAPCLQDLTQGFAPHDDRVVAVPLFPSRLKKRGLNQSLLLARMFFPTAGASLLLKTLIRTRNTPPQTSLDGVERRKNLRQAFTVRNSEAVHGRRVFLVDDIFTTGTTVTECSRALLAAGAARVEVLTMARVAAKK